MAIFQPRLLNKVSVSKKRKRYIRLRRRNIQPMDSWTLWYSRKLQSRQTSETRNFLRRNTMDQSPPLHPSRSYKRRLGRFGMTGGMAATLDGLTSKVCPFPTPLPTAHCTTTASSWNQIILHNTLYGSTTQLQRTATYNNMSGSYEQTS